MDPDMVQADTQRAAPALRLEQPELLMLADCLPAPLGAAARMRAWQLLRLVSRSHRVHLCCLADGPIHLSQWRTLRRAAEAVCISPAGTAGRLAPDPLPRVDAVLCTHPRLWRQARRVPARLHLCDTATATTPAAVAEPDGEAVWIAACAPASLSRGAGMTLVVPPAVDVEHFDPGRKEDLPAGGRDSRIVVHADWSDAASRRAARRLVTELRRGVDGAGGPTAVTPSGPGCGPDLLDPLRTAAVVAIADGGSPRGAWPMLSAMALGRAVVAPAALWAQLGLLSPPPTLAVQGGDTWAEKCLAVADRPDLARQLGQAARTFAATRANAAATGSALLGVLAPPAPLSIPAPLARAA